jgi:hypothetical protein
MHYSTIRNHLKPYVIVARRKTTINHAFAAAIAPSDKYIADTVREVMLALGQAPESLLCAYCGAADSPEHIRLTEIKADILELLGEADQIAKLIRERQANN